MPRDSQGQYSLPPIYLAVTGQTVLAEQHNTPLSDIAAALTGSLPRNGTGSMLANLPMGGYRMTSLGDGIAPTDAVTVAQALASGVPIGTILEFGGAQAPTGYLLCYGQAVSRTTYADLFLAIGTAFGAGDGATTFQLPDYRGRLGAGRDDMGGTAATRLTVGFSGISGVTLGAAGGSEAHTLTSAQMPVHNHGGFTSSDGTHSHPYSSISFSDAGSGFTPGATLGATFPTNNTSDAGLHRHVVGSDGGGAAHNNTQPTIVVNKIIKALNV